MAWHLQISLCAVVNQALVNFFFVSISRSFLNSHCIIAIGRLCEKCDGKCPVCDSYVRPETLVRICDECNFGTYGGRCIICGAPGERETCFFKKSHIRTYLCFSGISDAYYCAECTRLEKDRDGCPKIVNLGASRTDLFYERRRLGMGIGIV